MRGPDDKTRLRYWFPLIEQAGINVPKTAIVKLAEPEEATLFEVFDGKDVDLSPITTSLRLAAALVGGAPIFLRTDFTSGKHQWKRTCFVHDLERLDAHVVALAEFSLLADFIGFPIDTFVVREMLKTRAIFTAFRGEMPITREFRFFINDHGIEHVQPYWPQGAIWGETKAEGWKVKLDTISAFKPGEEVVLGELALAAWKAVGGGYWSVDILETIDRGWVVTDMAEGEKSFKWDPKNPTLIEEA